MKAFILYRTFIYFFSYLRASIFKYLYKYCTETSMFVIDASGIPSMFLHL